MSLRIVNAPLIEHVYEYEVVLVPMSVYNSMNKGFKNEVSINFKEVLEKESETPYGDNRKYGTIFPVETDGITFCLCYMYKTPFNKKDNDTVRYDELGRCLSEVAKRFHGKRIAAPIMGVSIFDGCGDREKILDIMSECLSNENVTIYDYEQEDYGLEIFHEIAELHKKFVDGEIDSAEYIVKRSNIEWRRKNGIYKKMPEGYKYIPKRNGSS